MGAKVSRDLTWKNVLPGGGKARRGCYGVARDLGLNVCAPVVLECPVDDPIFHSDEWKYVTFVRRL